MYGLFRCELSTSYCATNNNVATVAWSPASASLKYVAMGSWQVCNWGLLARVAAPHATVASLFLVHELSESWCEYVEVSWESHLLLQV